METFPDLRDFLLLRDPTAHLSLTGLPRCAFSTSTNGLGWRRGLHPFEVAVMLYDIAKDSWTRYGDDGPPDGTTVQMLEDGHGGRAGVIRTLRHPTDRERSQGGEGYFYLGRDAVGVSLVERSQWWIHFRVAPELRDDIDKALF